MTMTDTDLGAARRIINADPWSCAIAHARHQAGLGNRNVLYMRATDYAIAELAAEATR